MKLAISILALLIGTALATACGGGERTEPAGTATAAPTSTPIHVPTNTPTRESTATSTPDPTRTPTPEVVAAATPAPAVGIEEYLSGCGEATRGLIAALDIDILGPGPGEPVTWADFAQTLDRALATYGGLEPPAELGAYHAAHVDVLRSLRDTARARPGADSVSGDLAALVSEVILPELLEQGLGADITEEQERLLERVIQERFGQFFGPAFMSALLTEEQAIGTLSVETREAVEDSGCYLAFSPFEIDAPPEIVVPDVLVIEDDHGDSLEQATRIGIGDEIPGNVDFEGDLDFFEFAALEGMTFRIDVESLDPRVSVVAALFDSRGELLADNEDIELSPIDWRAGRSGSFYAAVGAEVTGSYTLVVTLA